MPPQERSDLWARIDAFEFDAEGTALTFARRLARENGWTIGRAHRVIREYRRFLYLAMTAGHSVTPSDAVDQAWHLHLTYTRSYWHGLCRDVLRAPLHHDPTRGGDAEGVRFEDAYARTRNSYEAAFGEPPPSDLWPGSEVRFGSDLRHVRVNRATHWLVPKGIRWGWRPRGPALPGLALAGVAGGGCGVLYRTYPFSQDGGAFLVWFSVFAIAAFLGAAVLRWSLRRSAPGRSILPTELPSDPYLVAFLAGGQARAVQSAIVSLAARGSAQVIEGKGLIAIGPNPIASDAHPFEKAVHACLDRAQGQSVRELARETRTTGEVLRAGLEERGLWSSASRAKLATRLPLAIALIVPAVAAFRTFQGISTGHDSGFIGFGAVVTLVLGLALFARHAGRSSAGTAALNELRRRNRPLRSEPAGRPVGESQSGMSMLPFAVALFGSSVLAGTELNPLRRALRPADTSATGCGTSSGCGTGGGDGGGGGGGCGGCGGGD